MDALWRVPPFAIVAQYSASCSGVTIIGAPYLASGVSTTASNLLSRNVADVLAHFVRDGKLAIDLNEELDNAMVVAGRGEEAKKEEE